MNGLNCIDGSVGLAIGATWISRTIAWFLKSNYSHTFLGLHYGAGQGRLGPMILEADSHGVEIDALDVYAKREKLIELYEPLLAKSLVSKAMDAIFEKYHRSHYGYLQLLGFVPIFLLRRIGIRVGNFFGGGIICSELIWEYLRELGFKEIYQSKKANSVTPGDVKEAMDGLVEKGAFKKVSFKLDDGYVDIEEHDHPDKDVV